MMWAGADRGWPITKESRGIETARPQEKTIFKDGIVL